MMKKKCLSMVLALVMVLGLAPVGAGALSSVYSHSSEYRNSVYYTQLCNVNLTGNYVNDIVNVAMSQVGYHEGNSVNDYGGGNTGGSGNYCEYNKNYWKWDANGDAYAWCAVFVSWCARQARVPSDIIPDFAGCTTAFKKTFQMSVKENSI